MSSQIVEREICGYIAELQQQGRHTDAALLDMALFHAQGYLPRLCEVRDEAERICGADR
jgi:hypothetical protein